VAEGLGVGAPGGAEARSVSSSKGLTLHMSYTDPMINVMGSVVYKLVIVMCMTMSTECYQLEFTEGQGVFGDRQSCVDRGVDVIEKLKGVAQEHNLPPFFVTAQCLEEDGSSI